MNVRFANALAVLLAGVGWLTAKGPAPAVLPTATASAPVLAPAAPHVGAAGPGIVSATPTYPAAPVDSVVVGDGNSIYAAADYLIWKVGRNDGESLNGGRFVIGGWTDATHALGFEAQGVFLERGSNDPILGTGGNSFLGGELNCRSTCVKIGTFELGTLWGARYFFFEDEAGTLGLFADRARVRNHFVGAQVGVDAQITCGSLYLYSRFVVAGGPTFQQASLPGFLGDRDRTRFNAVPWLTLKLGYQCTSWARVSVGYDAASLGRMGSAVVGDPINVNGLAVPTFGRGERDSRIQGFSLGLEVLF